MNDSGGCGCFGAVVVVIAVGTLIYCNRVPEEERGIGTWLLACLVAVCLGVFGIVMGRIGR